MQLEQLLLLIGALFSIAFLFPSPRKRRKARTASQNLEFPRHKPDSRKFPRHKLDGRVVRITDGDGLIAVIPGFGKLNIRLAHIDAPERGQPWGGESKQALERMLDRADTQFRLLHRDQRARAVAVVWSGSTVINEEMVRLGHAWMYDQYVPSASRPHYRALMEQARESRSGLWGTGSAPVPPWQWRQKAAKPRPVKDGSFQSPAREWQEKPARPSKRAGSRLVWSIILLFLLFLFSAILG